MTIDGILSILLVLGLCVMFHEAGHFLLAKLSGMRVDEFAVGFGKRLASFRHGETVYRINLVPLGGYVKIAGMEPGEADVERGFYRFPRWQGATVLFAGSLMNVVLAGIAFTLVAVFSGLPVFPDRVVEIVNVFSDSPAKQAGLRAGDQIESIDGIKRSLLISEVQPGGPGAKAGLTRSMLLYAYSGNELHVPGDLLAALQHASGDGQAEQSGGAGPPQPEQATLAVDTVTYDEAGNVTQPRTIELPISPDLPRKWTQAQAGHILQQALGVSFAPLDHGAVAAYLAARPNRLITLKVHRDGQSLTVKVTPEAEWARVATTDQRGRLASTHQQVGRIGIVVGGKTERTGLAKGLVYGADQSWAAVTMVATGLAEMLRGKIAPEASGPVGIAAMTADRARMGWAAVVSLGGVISANLAVINLFPFPPFDGFRLVLLMLEGIVRRRVNARIELALTITGVAVILGLFMIITFQDIFNLMRYSTP